MYVLSVHGMLGKKLFPKSFRAPRYKPLLWGFFAKKKRQING